MEKNEYFGYTNNLTPGTVYESLSAAMSVKWNGQLQVVAEHPRIGGIQQAHDLRVWNRVRSDCPYTIVAENPWPGGHVEPLLELG